MPKLIDYGVRFEFLREAAFVVVRDQGIAALSRHSVAATMSTSVNTVRRLLAADASLVGIAADHVADRRRHGRFGGRLRDAEPVAGALHLLRKLLPDQERRVAEEFVWFRLLLGCHRLPVAADEAREALGERFRIAQRGYDERDLGWDDADANVGNEDAARAEAADAAWERQRALRERDVTGLVDDALTLLSVTAPDRSAERLRTRALLEGLTLQVCIGNATPGEAVACLERHLELLQPGLRAPDGTPPRIG